MKKAIIVILAASLLMMISSCSKDKSEDSVSAASWDAGEDNSVVSVEALTVSRGKLVTNVSGSGIIRGASEAWSIAESDGIIEEVYVSPGSYVKEGDPLLKVEDNLAYWDMTRAEKQYEMSTIEYKGTKNSFENGGTTEIEYKRVLAEWHNRRLIFEQAKKAYEDCTLKAPISGYVSVMDTSLSRGNYLNRNTRVLKVVNRENFVLEIFPGQREIGLINKDSPVSVHIELADRILENKGSILDISGGSDESSGSFPVRILWENTWGDEVLPGMTARVEVATNGAVEGIIVPFDKVVERNGDLWVFLSVKESGSDEPAGEEGVVLVRKVRLGARLGNRVMIEEGLQEGDVLITSGFASLSPDKDVKLTLLGKTGDFK